MYFMSLSKNKKVDFYLFIARMVPVFHNSFDNGLTKIIRNIIKVNLFSSSLRLGTKLEKRVFKSGNV